MDGNLSTAVLRILPRGQIIRFWVLILLVFFVSIIETTSIYLFLPLLDLLSDQAAAIEKTIHQNAINVFSLDTETYLLAFGLFVLAFSVFRFSAKAYLTVCQARFTKGIYVFVTTSLLNNYLRKGHKYYLEENSSVILKHLTKETINFQTAATALVALVTDAIVAVLIIICLIVVDPVLALFAVLFGSILMGSISKKLRSKTLDSGKQVEQQTRNIYKVASEALQSIDEVRLYGKQSYFTAKFSAFVERHAENTMRGYLYKIFPGIIYQGAMVILLTLLILYFAASTSDFTSIIPSFGFFALALQRTSPAVSNIYQSIATIRHLRPGLQIVVDELTTSLHEDLSDDQRKMELSKEFGLRNAVFTYPGEGTPLINKLNISINKETIVGIIGPTGGGKSTLINLLSGQYQLDSGEIYVDGRTLVDQEILGLQNIISIVPQQVFILDDTVSANIAFGIEGKERDEDRIWEVLKIAQMDDYIHSLPETIETVLGERGTRLSVGQCQRLGIARALYRDPAILLFDEATSAMDQKTEKQIMDCVHELRGELTIVMIAHRLNTVEICDHIFVVENGSITEQGDYAHLCREPYLQELLKLH